MKTALSHNMKTALKILVLVFITAFAMLSCETSPLTPNENEPHIRPNDFYELHHHIRPTKPIKIPDTMNIMARPAIFTPQIDSIPQDTTINKEEGRGKRE